MMGKSQRPPVVLILDCGATNIRAIAVDGRGNLVAHASETNRTVAGSERPGYHVWPIDRIWRKLSSAVGALLQDAPSLDVAGIAVTTFGVDGTIVDSEGAPLYPVISWMCPRTVPVMENIGRYMDPDELRSITGLGDFSFNTIYKLVWLRENRPELVDKATHFLFISSLINHRLTGVKTTDWTMLGTSMLTDKATQGLDGSILRAIGLRRDLFPPLSYPGHVIGELSPEASKHLGIRAGTPVISCGHDTQFAVFGSGAEIGEPVLSSGTWEVLMVRTGDPGRGASPRRSEVTTEFDAERGKYNLGVQWLASLVIENLKHHLFSDAAAPDVYNTMITEAEAAPNCAVGPSITLDMLREGSGSVIRQLARKTGRGGLFRRALLLLANELGAGLGKLEEASQTRFDAIRLVGGGARNRLWNQLKADAAGVPVRVLETKETTVLGAAFFAMAGAGIHSSASDARAGFDYRFEVVNPQ
jgi:L-fuculokinase